MQPRAGSPDLRLPHPTEPGAPETLGLGLPGVNSSFNPKPAGPPQPAAWLGELIARGGNPGRSFRVFVTKLLAPTSARPPPAAALLPAPFFPTATLPGSRAWALAVNDCPARGPDPYLHSSAPGPARPPANLRPRHWPASPGARAHAEGRDLAALPKRSRKPAARLLGKPGETPEEGSGGLSQRASGCGEGSLRACDWRSAGSCFGSAEPGVGSAPNLPRHPCLLFHSFPFPYPSPGVPQVRSQSPEIPAPHPLTAA